jgi:hypothetical protein
MPGDGGSGHPVRTATPERPRNWGIGQEHGFRPGRIGLGAILVAVAAWCGWASSLHRATGAARAAWICTAAAVVTFDLLYGRARRDRQAPRPETLPPATWRSAAPWFAVAVLAVAWDLLGIDTGPHEAHLTLSALTQAFRPLNAAVLLLWVAIGVGYGVTRARIPRPERTDAQPGPASAAATLPFGGPSLLLPAARSAGVAFWLGIAALCLLLHLVGYRTRGAVATAGGLVRLLSASPWASAVLMALWLGVGFHLFAD